MTTQSAIGSSAGDAQFIEARRYLVGGTSAPARIHPALGRPLYVDRAAGPRIWDLDGREYLDLCNSHGASLLGHGHPAIRQAAERAFDLGVACAYETRHHGDLAKTLTEIIPCADLVRYTNSGTETTWHAIRTARAFTGREKIVKFEGHFHGYHDYLGYSAWPTLEAAGPESSPNSVPDSAGIPAGLKDYCIVLPFNDLHVLETTLRKRRDEIAAVILEPINYDSWTIQPLPGYLEGLRELTKELGIVLIFDEILSGFRTGLGCAQEYYGVTPDLCTLGKALGGGTALSAFMGRREIMEQVAPLGPAVQSGTYNAHLITILAAQAFLAEAARPDFYPTLLGHSERLYFGLRDIIARSGVKARVQAVGARFGILFGIGEGPENEVTSYRQATVRDRAAESRFFVAALRHGVFVLGIHHGLSAAYTDQDVEELLSRLELVFRDVAQVA